METDPTSTSASPEARSSSSTTHLPVLAVAAVAAGALRPPALCADSEVTRDPEAVSPALLRRARAVAEALFEDADGPPSADRLDWVERELASFLGHSGTSARLLLGACFFVLSVFAPWSIGRLGPLASLPLADRRRALERIEAGPLAPTFLGAKALLCIVYYEHEGAARAIGSDGLCLRGRS